MRRPGDQDLLIGQPHAGMHVQQAAHPPGTGIGPEQWPTPTRTKPLAIAHPHRRRGIRSSADAAGRSSSLLLWRHRLRQGCPGKRQTRRATSRSRRRCARRAEAGRKGPPPSSPRAGPGRKRHLDRRPGRKGVHDPGSDRESGGQAESTEARSDRPRRNPRWWPAHDRASAWENGLARPSGSCPKQRVELGPRVILVRAQVSPRAR